MGALRADRGGNDRQIVVPALGGGIDTLTAAHTMAPDTSPDCLNVVLNQGAVEKRGAFVPLCRQTPKVSSLRNRGFLARGRETAVSASNTDYKTVVGAAYAGHRACWDDAEIRNGLTIDFFCTVDDLTTSHGGNGAPVATSPFSPSPYTVKVRPILSKGPTKRWADTAQLGAPHTTNAIAWQTTSVWGPLGGGNHAMPFCVYLFNNGGTWEFRFSFHYGDGVNWQLKTLATPIAALGGVRLNTLYQVTCGYSIPGNSCFLRVRARFDTGSPQAVTVTDTIGGGTVNPMPNMTPTPVQVFDCPQAFIETTSAASATLPPGLNLGATADGGYWFASLRFEGQIEDIVIYRGLVTNAATGALDRAGRIDPDAPPAERLQHWPVDGDTDDVVEERAGVGNHLYRTPAGPIFDTVSGGPGGGSLAFNGQTSYALIETATVGQYSWRRKADSTIVATMDYTMRGPLPHGLEVVFWPEAIEPNFEQVIFEIHSWIRLVVTFDGFIRAYVRDGTAAPASPLYQTAGTSTRRVVPGQRYHVAVIRNTTGTNVDLVINGILDVSTVVAFGSAGWPISGVTLGMGAFRFTSASTTSSIEAVTAGSDQINTDSRSGFFGRIEYARILLGEYPFATPVPGYGSEVPSQHRAFDVRDYTLPLGKHFDFPVTFAGARNDAAPFQDDEDPLPNISVGHVATTPQHRAATGELHTEVISAAGAAVYTVGAVPTRPNQSIYHLYAVLGIRKALGAWDFSEPIATPYPGGYSYQVETTLIAGPDTTANVEKQVWMQRPYVQDLLDCLGGVQLRCIESDTMREYEGAGTWSFAYQRRYKPYLIRSPKELAPAWAEGLLQANLGENPIALLAGWTEERTGDHFTFARARRSLYWVKRPWRLGSPFRSEVAAESLWFFGQRNDACRAASMTAHGAGLTWAAHAAFIDLWIKPTRLDGKRLLVCYGDNIGATIRYVLWLDQGTLYVGGEHAGGFWVYFHGGLNGSATLRETSVALNKWTHIQVALGGVTVRINGQQVTMSKHPSSPLIDAAAMPSATTLWIGGMDADQMAFHKTSFTFLLQPFCGQITDVRERSTDDTTYWDVGESGVAPQGRAVTDANTRWLYAASSDTGWSVPSAVAGVPNLEVRIRELVGVVHDLADAGRRPASAAVFRNTLVFTQTGAFPQRVRFTSFADPLGPFRCHRLGMEAPMVAYGNAYAKNFQLVTQADPSAATFVPADATYAVYVAFGNDLGEESEADLVASRNADAVTSYAVLHCFDIPRSPDPQVTERHIYLSIGGATPLYVGSLRDNETRFFEIQARGAGTLAANLDGNNNPAPIARKVTVGQGMLVLTTLDGNPNSFAASGAAPAYFPTTRLVVVDSEDGEAAIAAISYLGTVFIFKRDGTWAFVAASLQDSAFAAGLRPVNSSAAAAGGAAIYDNVVYGASGRGVWMFDGSNYVYASPQLEGEFPEVLVDAEGLLVQQAAFLESEGQYWLSVRLRGEDFNHRVYVLHAEEGRKWTKLDLPSHIALTRLDDPRTRRPQVAIGTLHGLILGYDPDAGTEGVRDVNHHGGAQMLEGTPGSTTTTTLTIADGALDVAYDGLRGRALQFLDASGSVLAERTIVSNTATVITWDDPYTVPAGATFAVGGYTGYWSSPWVAPQMQGSYLRLEFIDLDFTPSPASLILEHQMAHTLPTDRVFDDAGAELQTQAMTKGYQDQPKPARTNKHGRYARIRFGTNGRARPFSVTRYALRFGDAGTQGRPS